MESVAIIIPTYNCAPLVKAAVASVLEQVRPGDEIIVIDDGSSDSTEEVLKPLGTRITYIRTENHGAAEARNFALCRTKAPLVAFLDADDEWLPGKLELQRRLMAARPDVLFCFSDFRCLRDGGRIVANRLQYWQADHGLDAAAWAQEAGAGQPYSAIASLPDGVADFPVHIADFFAAEVKAPCVNTSSTMVRREKAGEALHFDGRLSPYEDWLCYLNLAKRGPGAFLKTETLLRNDTYDRPRVTAVEMLVKISARVELLERLDSADRERFKDLLSQRRTHKAAILIGLGRTREAREELRRAPHAPASYRLMAALPGPVARTLFEWRKALKKGS